MAETAARESAREKTPRTKADVSGKSTVKLRLFKDNDRYRDALYVAVNGEDYLVPRGVEVEVPDYIAEVIENSIRQDQTTCSQMERLEDRYNRKTAAQG